VDLKTLRREDLEQLRRREPAPRRRLELLGQEQDSLALAHLPLARIRIAERVELVTPLRDLRDQILHRAVLSCSTR
jgi:hypothetical protein